MSEESDDEALRERLVKLMPLDTRVTDLWNWDIRFEEESFGDIEDAAFSDDDQLKAFAENLADDFLGWIDKWGMDYNQEGWNSDEAFEEWIRDECMDFMRRWRANVKREFGR